MIATILGLTIFLLPIIIIVLVVLAFIKSKNSEESFEKKVRTIYKYAVISISLIMMVVGIISLFNTFLTLVLPDTYQNTSSIMIEFYTEAAVVAVAIPLFLYHNHQMKD